MISFTFSMSAYTTTALMNSTAQIKTSLKADFFMSPTNTQKKIPTAEAPAPPASALALCVPSMNSVDIQSRPTAKLRWTPVHRISNSIKYDRSVVGVFRISRPFGYKTYATMQIRYVLRKWRIEKRSTCSASTSLFLRLLCHNYGDKMTKAKYITAANAEEPVIAIASTLRVTFGAYVVTRHASPIELMTPTANQHILGSRRAT